MMLKIITILLLLDSIKSVKIESCSKTAQLQFVYGEFTPELPNPGDIFQFVFTLDNTDSNIYGGIATNENIVDGILTATYTGSLCEEVSCPIGYGKSLYNVSGIWHIHFENKFQHRLYWKFSNGDELLCLNIEFNRFFAKLGLRGADNINNYNINY